MSKVLLVYKEDYADEFYVHGLEIIDAENWEEIKQEVKEYFSDGQEKTYSFGTNEWLSFWDYEDWLAGFRVVDLTNEEEATIRKCLNGGYFGVCPTDIGER